MKLTEQESLNLQSNIETLSEGNPDHPTYRKRVRKFFNLNPITISEKKCYYLAGFIEGEGSISISAKKNQKSRFGCELDPSFNITQHVNGISNLYLALEIFQTGRIRFKENSTLTFNIDARKSIQEKVCPFFEKYLIKSNLSSEFKQTRFKNYKKMLDLFDEKAHLNRDRFVNELLPIWDSMRMQHQINQGFKDLKEAQGYVTDFNKE
jgi:hypothetical protein